ncbi:MAG TPA: metallophosphoesterase [Polyangium sp.]|nr:metallophosphoesterase [Polyangium sp.]
MIAAFLRFSAFMLGAIVVAAITYFWLDARLLRSTAFGKNWERRLRRLLVVLSTFLPLGMLQLLFFRECPRTLATPLMWLAFGWIGILFFLLVALIVAELPLRVAYHFAPARRTFFSRVGAAFAAVAAASCSALGLHEALGGFMVRQVRLSLRNLPARPDGKPYRLVQLSDLHVSAQIGGDFVREVVERTNALTPDGIVITGDLVDGGIPELGPHLEPLRDLRAPDGIFAVTGNHEYLSGADEWIAFFQSLGLRILRNELVELPYFDLAGIDDDVGPSWLPHHGPNLSKALANRTRNHPVVLLAHRPTQLPNAAEHDVDLQLSGHTHGGQIKPLHLLESPYIWGLYQLKKTVLYVSAGTGYWGPPMRLGTRAEITLFEFVPSEEQGA